MKRADWLLILGVVAGAFAGAVPVSYYAMQHCLEWYIPYRGTGGSSICVASYNLLEKMVWTVVGIIVGGFLGALGVSILRAVNRHKADSS
jgi:hypothetical protein